MSDIGAAAGRAAVAGVAGFAAGGPLGALVGVASQIVPEIVKAIAGDSAGETATQVAQVVQAVAGTDDAVTAAAIIQGDASKAIELRTRLLEIQVAAEERRRAAELEVLRLEVQSQDSARRQTVDLAASRSPLAYMTALVTVWLLGLLTYILAVVWGRLNPDAQYLVLGQIMGMVAGGVAYWLGSSSGSFNKDNKIAALMGSAGGLVAPPPPPPPSAPEVAPARRSLFSRSA
jgi:hypothetical protein